jgi:hypothetical protein
MNTNEEHLQSPESTPNEPVELNNNEESTAGHTEENGAATAMEEPEPEPEFIPPADIPMEPVEAELINEPIVLPAEEDAPEDVHSPNLEEQAEEITAESNTGSIETEISEMPAAVEESAENSVLTDLTATESNSGLIETIASETPVAADILPEETNESTIDALEPLVAYNELTREELVQAMKDLAGNPDLDNQKGAFNAIRDAFRKIKDDEGAAKKMKFLEHGGDPEEFEILRDEIDQMFDDQVRIFIEQRNEQRKHKERELNENLKKKREILAELKKLLEDTQNISASFDRLHELQNLWRAIGLVPSVHVDELWKNYHHHINNFYEIIKINKELRELDQKKNLDLKTELCLRAEALLLEESIGKSLDDYKILQDQWKEIGQVAREQSEVIWERFRSAGDKLFDRRREYIQGQEAAFTENLSKKTAVCERAELIVGEMPFQSHNHWQEASEKMAATLEDWKKIGFASRKDNEAVWERFKRSRDAFYASKEEFYQTLRNTQNQNYKQKVDLCMEAEALKESNEWKKAGDRMRELQELWKKSGPVAKKHSDKLWVRFRKACDGFYENRNQHFAGMNSEQDENLRKKQELVARIEAFESSEDLNANFEILKAFQAEWIEIGHVPLKEKDELNKRYRTGIDKQFTKIKSGNAEAKRQVFRNQVSNLSGKPEGKDKLFQQKNVVQDKIRRMQTELQTLENNIGFLANSKSKAADDMRRDIERKIGKVKEEIGSLFDQLKILKEA